MAVSQTYNPKTELPGRPLAAGRGFSVIEVLIAIVVVGLIAGIGVPSVQSSVRQARADAAMNMVLNQLRLARGMAVDQRRVTRVTLNTGGSISVARREMDSSWSLVTQSPLPTKTQFRVEPGVPTEPTETPDGLGAGSAIDFGGASQIFFTPNGSATRSDGEMVSGIVYLAIAGYLDTARAVSVFGGTGRTRGWSYRETEEGWEWQ